MTIPTTPGGIDNPEMPNPGPDPEPKPEPDPQPGGPVPDTGPPMEMPGADQPPMRLPRDNPDVETEI